MVDFGQKLSVDREAAVERVSRIGYQAHGKLPLEHDNSTSEGGPVREKLECEGRRDLVGDVGNADVEVGKIALEHIRIDHLKFA